MNRRPGDRAGRIGPRDRRARRVAFARLHPPGPRPSQGTDAPTHPPSAAVQRTHELAREGDPDALAIVARWAELGDEATWAWLLKECEAVAAVVVRRGTGRRDADLAAELAQQTVLELHAAIVSGRFDPSRLMRVQNFMRVISSRLLAKFVVRRARDRAAAERHGRHDPGINASTISEASLLADEVHRELELDPSTIRKAVGALPEPERTAVILHARGLSLTQIANELGFRSKSGTRRVLLRGLRRVLESVERGTGQSAEGGFGDRPPRSARKGKPVD